jgi:CelD/BcsL family acetyltransferase involved in cellulose biosynthesis
MRRGNLKFTAADSSNWAEIFDALERLHTMCWQHSGEQGVLADAKVLAWHREALPRLLASGLLRLCSLRLDSKVIGVLYSLIDPASRACRTQYVYLTAYSLEHADLRPGTLLLGFAIEHAAQEGVQTIDMLRGNEAYKSIWHVERTPTYGFTLSFAAQGADLSCVAGGRE